MKWRGQILRKTGPTQQLVRLTATALAVSGFGCEPPTPPRVQSPRRLPVIPPTASAVIVPAAPKESIVRLDDFPPDFERAEAHAWQRLAKDAVYEGIKKRLAELPSDATEAERKKAVDDLALSGRFAGLAKLLVGKPSAEVILLGLDELEEKVVYGELVASLAFRASEHVAVGDLPGVLARVEQHVRVAIALKRADAISGPVKSRAWISKAGDSFGESSADATVRVFLNNARKAYENGDAGRWDVDALMRFEVVGSGLRIWERGAPRALDEGQIVTLRRLDVLEAHDTDVKLAHNALGVSTLQSGAMLTTWNVAQQLSPEGREIVKQRVDTAAAGGDGSLDALDGILPAARTLIVDALSSNASAPGAPGLRMQLTLMLE